MSIQIAMNAILGVQSYYIYRGAHAVRRITLRYFCSRYPELTLAACLLGPAGFGHTGHVQAGLDYTERSSRPGNCLLLIRVQLTWHILRFSMINNFWRTNPTPQTCGAPMNGKFTFLSN